MDGIVACETLYPDLPRLAPDAAIRYVPQWYHEFPINAPSPDRAHEALQAEIDALEATGVDRVIVVYHEPAALPGLQAESVPLLVYDGRDCIELQLAGAPTGPGGECKEPGAYYLTRGWIDVGVDSYKVYTAYAGELTALESKFLAAKREQQEMRVSWPKSETISRAADRSEVIGTDPAAMLRTVMDSYREVRLLDTGRLFPFHHEYAETFRRFLAETVPEEGTREVSLSVRDGELDALESIVTAPESTDEVRSVDPGAAVPADLGTPDQSEKR